MSKNETIHNLCIRLMAATDDSSGCSQPCQVISGSSTTQDNSDNDLFQDTPTTNAVLDDGADAESVREWTSGGIEVRVLEVDEIG